MLQLPAASLHQTIMSESQAPPFGCGTSRADKELTDAYAPHMVLDVAAHLHCGERGALVLVGMLVLQRDESVFTGLCPRSRGLAHLRRRRAHPGDGYDPGCIRW